MTRRRGRAQNTDQILNKEEHPELYSEYDKDHTHLLEMLQYLLYTVRYDRLYLDHLENNDKGNR